MGVSEGMVLFCSLWWCVRKEKDGEQQHFSWEIPLAYYWRQCYCTAENTGTKIPVYYHLVFPSWCIWISGWFFPCSFFSPLPPLWSERSFPFKCLCFLYSFGTSRCVEVLSEGSQHCLALADAEFHQQFSAFLSSFVPLRFFLVHFHLD